MLLSLFKSLADETRLRLLNILAHGELSVQDLTDILQMGQSRISRHLKILHQAGLVTLQRQGTWSYYRLASCEGWLGEFRRLLEPQLGRLPDGGGDLLRMTRLMERKQAANRDFFNRHARQWDELKQASLPLISYQGALLERIGGGDLLVEIGLGTGSLLPRLSPQWRRLIGIDQSPAMLAEAGRRVQSLEGCEIELRLGEMAALPLPDGQAEAVLMNMVLHHASQPARVLQDVRRVLRPGGRLVLADLPAHDCDWAREVLADVWLGFDPAELARWLKTSGFEVLSIETLAGDSQHQGVLLVSARTSKMLKE